MLKLQPLKFSVGHWHSVRIQIHYVRDSSSDHGLVFARPNSHTVPESVSEPLYTYNSLCYNTHMTEQQCANIKMDLFGDTSPKKKTL